MSNTLPAIGVALFFLAASFALPQSTWHVDVNGTPPGDGSAGNPYTSIQYAIDQAGTVDGDTILVAPGTYVEVIDYHHKGVLVKSVAGPGETFVRAPDPTTPLVVHVYASIYGHPAVFEGFDVSRDTSGPAPIGTVGMRLSGDTEDLGYTTGRATRCTVREHRIGIQCGYIGFVDECTVTDCDAIGVSEFSFGQIIMRNSISKENGVDLFVPAIGSAPSFVYYSNFDPSGFGFGSGTGNINQPPRWWDAANGDLRLRPGSPCIDTGTPDDPPDPDGSRIDMGAFTYDPFYAPGTDTYCFASAALCPCGNGGSGAGGCDIAQGTGGVSIGIREFMPSDSGGGTAIVFGTGYPVMSVPGVTLIRSPSAQDPPVVFGDGLRCIGTGGLVRVAARLAIGGEAHVSVMHGAGSGTFYYQLWNRNTPAMFCTPDAFNLSNGLSITWP